MNVRAWFESIERSPKRLAMPIVTSPGLTITGRSLTEAATKPEVQAEAVIALAKRYPSAGAMTMMDLSAEAEAFGCPIQLSEVEVPTVSSNIVSDSDSVNALAVPEVGDGRTGVYLKAAELVARDITDRPVFGCHIGPFSLAGRLYDLTEILIAHVTDAESIHTLLEKSTEFLVDYARAFKAAGSDGVIIAEPAASLLAPPGCREFSLQYVKRIIDAVQDDEFGVILHNCGNTRPHVQCMVKSGAYGLSFGNAVEMTEVLPQIPSGQVALGNVDPVGKLRMGSAEDARRCTRMLLTETAQFRNFIVSSGCDIPPGTPIENVDAFYEAVAEFNAAPAASAS
jgi:uroporphyrinogen decarboxylase